jgi:hypothetical protein
MYLASSTPDCHSCYRLGVNYSTQLESEAKNHTRKEPRALLFKFQVVNSCEIGVLRLTPHKEEKLTIT